MTHAEALRAVEAAHYKAIDRLVEERRQTYERIWDVLGVWLEHGPDGIIDALDGPMEALRRHMEEGDDG